MPAMFSARTSIAVIFHVMCLLITEMKILCMIIKLGSKFPIPHAK
jgi:hypothetical protein